jgi:hypothetical protein
VTLSSAFGEALPMVLGRRWRAAWLCVATDSGDAALIVGDAGVVVPPREPAALAAGWALPIRAGYWLISCLQRPPMPITPRMTFSLALGPASRPNTWAGMTSGAFWKICIIRPVRLQSGRGGPE